MRPTQLAALDLNLLFVADSLLESHSVTSTADAVHLSQPAVSRALGRLRAQLGDELMVRDGRRMVLTPFAQGLRPRLRAALMSLERAVFAEDEFVPALATGTLAIASQDFAAFSYLPQALGRFAAAAPHLEIAVVPYREPFETSLESNEVDVAVGPRPSDKSWIRSELLFESPWVCVGARGHALLRKPSLEAFCAAAHVLVSPSGQGGGPVDAALARLGKSRKVRLRVNDFAAALAVCAQTTLVGVVREALAARAGRVLPLSMRPLPMPMAPSRVFLSWHVSRNDEPRHRWLRAQVGTLSAREARADARPKKARARAQRD